MRSSSDISNSNKNRRFHFLSFLLIAIGFVVFGGMYCWQNAPIAQAATQTVLTCDETHLDAAISTASAGDTVIFSCSGIITLTNTINITKDLTLDGTGQNVTLSGGNAVEVLTVLTNTNSTINNLTIVNGKASANSCGYNTCGGGIFNSGILTVTNSSFISNSATDVGGAIFNNNGVIPNITNSTFLMNLAFDGSAIFNSGTINNLSNSTFSNNNGSAIANQEIIADIVNSTFISNSTGGMGGAIVNYSGIITNLANSTFTLNNSFNGGAVYNAVGATISKLTNSTFYGNFASDGGAVFNEGAISNLINSTFLDNSALYSGAAIYNNAGGTKLKNNILAQSGNQGNCAGGVPDVGGNLSDDGSCNFSQATSHNNVTNLKLGTLGNYGGTTQIIPLLAGSSAIGADSANCPTTDQRGFPRPENSCDAGAFQSGVVGNGTDSSLCNEAALNAALEQGGYILIYCPPNTTITLTANPDTTSNFRSIAISTTLDASPSISFTLSGNNTYEIFNINIGAYFSINGLIIANGKAPIHNCFSYYNCGGGIYNSGTLSISNSTFTNNTASDNGGVIYNSNSGTISSINNTTFTNNNSSYGGAIFNDGNGLITNIANTTFDKNTASYYGGAIMNNNSGRIGSISNSTFVSNTVNAYGGAVYSAGTIGNISNTTFVSNTASYGGGAIINNSANMTVTNSIFAKGSSGSNCYKVGGTFIDGGYNLDDDGTCVNGGVGSRQAPDAQLNLSLLQNNGGSTETIALLTGSVAIGFVVSGCPSTDQRGYSRPSIYCDAGAYQSIFTSTTTTLSSSNNPSSYGQNITLTASISPSVATGTVTFTLGSISVTAMVSNGAATYVTNTVPIGSTAITATYGGDSTYISSTSGTLTQMVTKNSSTTNLISSSNPSSYGQSITLTAVISPAAATGTVTFTMGSSFITNTVSSGVATYVTSTLPVGSTVITATYSGDSTYVASTNIMTQTVVGTNPSITLTSSTNPSNYGQVVTFTTAISPTTATGTVTFMLGSASVNAAVVNGVASCAITTLPVGSTTVKASYSGDSTYAASTSATLTQTVNPASTTTMLAVSPTSANLNDSVTFTATVAVVSPGSGISTGSVIFTDTTNNTQIGTATLNASGVATYTTTKLSGGSHSVMASYNGDTNFSSSTSSSQSVSINGQSGLTLSSSANPSVYGQSVTFTAAVAITNTANVIYPKTSASNTVTFTIDGKTVATNVTLDANSDATYVTNTLAIGQHSVVASYSGNTNVNSSTSATLTQTVNQANTTNTLTSSANPATFGQVVTLTATVSPTAATGTVTFTLGSTSVTKTISSGVATYVTNMLPIGSTTITATYSGDTNYAASTSNKLDQSVTANGSTTTLISSANPTVYGQAVTFTATVSPTAAIGTVSLSVGGTVVTQTLSNGTATYVTSTLPIGIAAVKASYNGDSNYAVSTSTTLTQTVNKASTTTMLAVSPTSANLNDSVTFTATVAAVWPGSGTPTGSIVFTDTTNNSQVGTATLNASGVATYTTTALSGGSYSITAGYSGDGNFTASGSNSQSLTVYNPTGVSVSSSANPSVYGQVVTFTATVATSKAVGLHSTGDNTVSFTIDGNTVAAELPLNNNVATYVTSTLSVGTHSAVAAYTGSTSNDASRSAIFTQTVSKVTPTVSLLSSATTITQGQSVSFTATVSSTNGTPSGTVTFYDGSTQLGSGVSLSNGTATYSTSSLSVGSHSITAVYSGDTSFNSASSSAIAVTVNASNNGGGGTNNTYTYYLPFVANNASSFTTYLAFQNVGTASANVTINYYDSNGNTLTASTLITTVGQYAEILPANPFSSGAKGAGVITSDQPLSVIVPEATPYGGSAYAVGSGSSNSLIAPFAMNNAFGDFTTQLNIFNGGDSAATATVTFYGTVGNATTITSSSTSVTIGAHQTANLNQNTLPSGFSGWTQITGSANTLVAQVLEQSPSTKFVAIANAVTNPSSTEYAPAIFNGGYGSFYTGANIINPNSSAVTVTVTYYDLSANATSPTPFEIPAYGVASIFNGATSGNGLPSGGLSKGFIGAVAVSSVGGPIAMSVNENGGVTAAGNSRSGTYAAIASGGSKVGLPVVSNGGYTYITGNTILNTSSQTVVGTITYYNTDGTSAGVSKSFTISGHGSEAYYQGDGSLPSDFYGTAVITETSGPANSLVVTTNAQNIALFYTYSEPNS